MFGKLSATEPIASTVWAWGDLCWNERKQSAEIHWAGIPACGFVSRSGESKNHRCASIACTTVRLLGRKSNQIMKVSSLNRHMEVIRKWSTYMGYRRQHHSHSLEYGTGTFFCLSYRTERFFVFCSTRSAFPPVYGIVRTSHDHGTPALLGTLLCVQRLDESLRMYVYTRCHPGLHYLAR